MDQRILHNRTNIQNSEQKYAIKTKSEKSKGFWGKLFGSSSKEKERRLDSIPQSQPIGRYVVTEHPRNVNPNHQAARPIHQRPRPQPDHTHSTIPIEKITKDSQTSTETRKPVLKEDSGLSLIRNQGPPELELREESSSGVKISNVVQKPNEPEEAESNEELQEESPTSPQKSSKILEDPTTPNSCCSPASSDHTQSSPLPSPTRISINDRSQIPDYLKSLQKAVRTDIPPPWSKIQPYPRMSTDERVPLELFYERNLKPTSNNQLDFQRGNISDGNSDCSSETSSSYEDIDYGPHSVVRTPFGPQMIGQQTIPPNINVQSSLRRSRSAPNAQGYLNQPPIMSIPDVAQSIPNLNVQMPSNMAAAALPIALMPLANMQTPIPAANPTFNYVPSPMEPSQYHYAAYAYPGLPISFLPESKIDLSAVPHRPNIQSPPVTTPPNVGYVDEVIVAPYRDKSPQWGKEGKNIS